MEGEVRIKGEQAVRDVRVQVRNITGQGGHFLFVHIPGNQKSAGNEEGGFWPL